MCNGMICKLGDSADPDLDTILVDGRTISRTKEKVYIMLNKPRGYVTTLSDEKGRKNVAQLVSDCGARVYPVGRLDMDSEGLLFLTNDGDFANRLMHPKHAIDKVYHAYVEGFTEEAVQALLRPIVLDGYLIKTPLVSVIKAYGQGKALLEITIHEGRNRQIRKMCASAGMCVIRLKRVMECNVALGDLPLGKWRTLTPNEMKKLMD